MNELPNLLTDKQYNAVKPFLNKKAVRDYNIAKEFSDRKSKGEKSGRIIDNLTSNNTLRRDTIKKILTNNKLKTR